MTLFVNRIAVGDGMWNAASLDKCGKEASLYKWREILYELSDSRGSRARNVSMSGSKRSDISVGMTYFTNSNVHCVHLDGQGSVSSTASHGI